jgi:transcriptional regulator with XRE-family HTH domain
LVYLFIAQEDVTVRIRIAEIRKAKGISQSDLAKRIGISGPYLHQLEKGLRKITMERQAEIAEALEVDPRDIVDFSSSEDQVERIMAAFDRASPADRAMILSWAQTILDRDPK